MDSKITFTADPPKLTPQERQVLAVLEYNAGRLISKTELGRQIGGASGRAEGATSNVLEVVAGRLRKKLAAAGANASIETVRQGGYRLVIVKAEPSHD